MSREGEEPSRPPRPGVWDGKAQGEQTGPCRFPALYGPRFRRRHFRDHVWPPPMEEGPYQTLFAFPLPSLAGDALPSLGGAQTHTPAQPGGTHTQTPAQLRVRTGTARTCPLATPRVLPPKGGEPPVSPHPTAHQLPQSAPPPRTPQSNRARPHWRTTAETTQGPGKRFLISSVKIHPGSGGHMGPQWGGGLATQWPALHRQESPPAPPRTQGSTCQILHQNYQIFTN